MTRKELREWFFFCQQNQKTAPEAAGRLLVEAVASYVGAECHCGEPATAEDMLCDRCRQGAAYRCRVLPMRRGGAA